MAYNNRGHVYQAFGYFSEALADYDKAILLDPNDPLSHNNRAGVLQELNRLEEALQSYNRAVELDPEDSTTFYNVRET